MTAATTSTGYAQNVACPAGPRRNPWTRIAIRSSARRPRSTATVSTSAPTPSSVASPAASR